PELRRLAKVTGLFDTPSSRQLLVELIRNDNLFARAAALRASPPQPDPTQAAVLEAVVERELQLARQLLHGQASAPAPLAAALAYDLVGVQTRLFGLLMRLHSPQLIAEAQRSVAHAVSARQAEALAMLANLVPPRVYHGLQILLDEAPPTVRARAFDQLLGPPLATLPPVAELVATQGLTAFADWTLAQALQAWEPTAATVQALLPHLRAQNRLVRESAFSALSRLAASQPAVHQALLHHWPDATESLSIWHRATTQVSAAARVRLLKTTALFADTPENVLSAIVPIMNEVAYETDEEIFAEGEPGASLFIVYEGEVLISRGSQWLATFGPGDFFGELALLDAAPRSATVCASGPVRAFRLDQDDFYDVMEERPEVLRTIVRVLCQRLRHQNEKMLAG
ncbi:MAG: cyclic nucleotide-binding domain-containing protein, partial [Bacteroidota bacterium]|nr:cyclic nucleotide-binding domain-containing protein [Bacteroidota bacterium]